jgi:hypothetical protein
MRVGEIFGSRVGSLRLRDEQPVIYVEQTLSRGGTFAEPKSERSRRSILLPKTLVALLAKRTEGKRRGDLVFTAPGGKPWDANNFRSRYWDKAAAAAQRCVAHPPVPDKVGNGKRLGELPTWQCPRASARHVCISVLVSMTCATHMWRT